MRVKRLTPLAKVLIFTMVVCIIGGIGLKLNGSKDIETILGNGTNKDDLYKKAEQIKKDGKAMNISLDEWIGWKPIIDANGGLTTQKGSIYDKLGLSLNISIINDATQSSNALIKGDLNGAGYTVNRLAFLYPKFKEANVDVQVPYITNSSTGGDGIIAKQGINRIEDIVGKKIGVPRFSEAQTLVEWLMSKSSLTQSQISDIRKNMIMFDTPDDAAKAFFAGQLDVAATWQPYLSQAQETTDAKILFSTKNATNIILDGIAFRQDYINSHKEDISKFIQGALQSESMYTTQFSAIKNTMPMFATEEDNNIKAMTGDATLADCKTNIQLLSSSGVAKSLYSDMCDIWTSIGEAADKTKAQNIFTDAFVTGLASSFPASSQKTQQFTEAQRNEAKTQDNNQALLSQRLTVNFETGSAAISPDSYQALNKFAETAKILNGTIIQIEGNTDNVGNAAANSELSTKRAKAVAAYLQYQGVDPTRFVVIGNGQDKPIADNGTDEGKAANRRTDAYFKIVK